MIKQKTNLTYKINNHPTKHTDNFKDAAILLYLTGVKGKATLGEAVENVNEVLYECKKDGICPTDMIKDYFLNKITEFKENGYLECFNIEGKMTCRITDKAIEYVSNYSIFKDLEENEIKELVEKISTLPKDKILEEYYESMNRNNPLDVIVEGLK